MSSHRDPSARDWHAWRREYDAPGSSLSRRLEVVRDQLDRALASLGTGRGDRVIRLVSLCAGDGRDTLPVLARKPLPPVRALLVELDEDLADSARAAAAELGLSNVEVRCADAGETGAVVDFCPADLVMLCGVFGNVSDSDVEHTVRHLPALLTSGAVVIWTRGCRVDVRDPSTVAGDPSERVRRLFRSTGFEEIDFVRPPDAGFRVGTNRLVATPAPYSPATLFTFTDGP